MTEQSAQEIWERSPGFVYFIAAGDPPDDIKAIKIGISTDATIEPVLKNHVNLDEFRSCNPKTQYPSISWDDWKNRIDKFLFAFEQIAEESWKTTSR